MPTFPASGILRADGLRLVRDRFLAGTALYLIGISLAMRWVIPWITRGVAGRWGFDLTPYHPLIVSHIVVQLAPLLVGILGAFLLLETREDRTIKALLVSPVPISGYLALLTALMILAASVLTMGEGIIIGFALPSWPALTAVAVVGALGAPVFAMGVSALASNKTEAFAYLKIVGLVPLLVSGSYFLSEPHQWLAAVYPPYWAVKAYWVAEAGRPEWPLWVLGGFLVGGLWAAGCARLFSRAARR
jgi:fluoroquinolone transport system permease protein